MAALSLIFDIIGRDNASSSFNNVGDAADRSGGKLGGLGKVGLAAGAALSGAAVLGVGALVSALKDGAAEFSDNQTAAAQLTATIKSTGDVAGITTAGITKLADSIEAKTGTDGASVVSGAALLATFTKVRNEAGEGANVFDRATQAGVDLAAKGFGSVEGNAVLLGKALNDPIKGLTALGKQGVSFTADQKDLIKSLVATGDTLGAQKIILAEVEAQVGGSAEAYGQTLPGQLARAGAAFDGVKETLFKAFLPIISSVLEFVNSKLLPGFQSLVAFFSTSLVPKIRELGSGFSGGEGLQGKFASVTGFINTTLVPAFKAIADFVIGTLVPTLVKFYGTILVALQDGFKRIAAVIVDNKTELAALGRGILALAGFIVTNLVPVISGVYKTAFTVVGVVISAAISLIAGIVRAFQTASSTAAALGAAITAAKTAISTAITAAAAAVTDKVGDIVSTIRGIGGKVTAAVSGFGSLLVGAGRRLMEGLASGIQDRIEAVVGRVREAAQKIKDLLPGSPIKDGPLKSWNGGGAGLRLMDLLQGGIAAGIGGVQSTLRAGLDIGDVAGMTVGGTAFINSRLGGPDPADFNGMSAVVAELQETRAEMRRLQDREVTLRRTGGL